MRILLNTAAGLFILGVGIGGYLLFGKPPEVPQDEQRVDPRPLVRTAPVAAYTRPVVIELDGDANAWRVITVGAQVRGQILRRMPQTRNGMRVEKGDILFEIDPTTYALEIQRLEAQLDQTEEEIRGVEVDIRNTDELIQLAEQEWELQHRQYLRIKRALDQGSAAQSEADTAARQELTARNALQTLRNNRRSLEQMLRQKRVSRKLVTAQLEQARVNMRRCTVRAPVTGRIVDDLVEEGDYVTDGQALVHISDSSRIEVTCSMTPRELAWILQKSAQAARESGTPLEEPLARPIPCEVAYSFEGTEVIWDGELSRFEGTGMDRDTRTFPCRVIVSEPSDYELRDSQGGRLLVAPSLLSGMYVTVRVPVEPVVPLLELPVEAVRPGGRVWVVRDGHLQVRPVRLAHSTEDHVLVRTDETDLTENDQVIVSPLVVATDGMEVRVETAP